MPPSRSAAGPDPDDLLDTLTSLVDKSILIREESGRSVRFRMLETLREYGHEKLAADRRVHPSLRRRHRDWYERLALDAEAEWISARQLDWIARLEREQPNLREALEFCVDDRSRRRPAHRRRTVPVLALPGPAQRGAALARSPPGRQPAEPTVDRVKALYCASVMAEVQGDLPVSDALVEEAQDARRSDEPTR